MSNIPEKFKLGTDHVKFFYNKLLYLKPRYQTLYDECILRSYNVQNYIEAWDNIPDEFMSDYKPSMGDRELLLEWIRERTKV